MEPGLTRRKFFWITLALSPIATTGYATAPQRQKPMLTAEDPVARALAFYPNTRDVPSDHPLAASHNSNQQCANCLHQRGPAGNGGLRCPTFPGKLVSENGWCRLWVKG